MAAKKVDVARIPKDILGDLQTLVSSDAKEFVAVGSNFYEIHPTSAPILMKSMSAFTELLEESRIRKIEKVHKLDDKIDPVLVIVTIRDLVSDPLAGEGLLTILTELLDGVDATDLGSMNIGQMLDALDKAIKVNLDTLPESFKYQFAEVADTVTPELPEDDGNIDEQEVKNP